MSESLVQDGTVRLGPLAADYLDSVLRGDRREAARRVTAAVDAGTPIKSIYLEVFQPVQYEIGRLWQKNLITVAQEHYCTAVTQMVMSQLYSRLFSQENKGKTLVAACVGGELHEIGIRMVADFFEMEGWDTYYLGANMPEGSIITALESQKADVLAISVSMAFHVNEAAELISAVRDSGYGSKVKILVGGRQFNQSPQLWKSIGADSYAPDAEAAVRIGERLFQEKKTQVPAKESRDQLKPVSRETLQAFLENRQAIMEEAARRWKARMEAAGKADGRTDSMLKSGTRFMTDSLASILSVGDLNLLNDQVAWSLDRLPFDGVDPSMLRENTVLYRKVIQNVLPGTGAEEILPYLDAMIGMFGGKHGG